MVSMHSALRLLFLFIISFAGNQLDAQSAVNKGCKPPINRARWHDLIDKEQKNLLKSDGKQDNRFEGAEDEEVNFLVTQAITQRVDALQCRIEADTTITHQKKVSYLSGVENILRKFTAQYKNKKLTASHFTTLLINFEVAMNKDIAGSSIEDVIQRNNYEISNILMSCNAFEGNSGYGTAKNILLLKYSQTYPDQVFKMLRDNPDMPYRDSLIKIGAYNFPNLLYDYAAANNKLGYAIRKLDDPLVQAISKIATSGGSGQLYFPFLDNIMQGKQTLKDIDAVKEDDVKYYKLLVKTRLDYKVKIMQGERIFGMDALEKRLEDRAKNYFIKTINALHDEPDNVRFRILNQLTPQELYYLAVFTESEIYTSSYVRGVYPYMMQKIGNRGDSLLLSVNFDKFKKFIRLAAGFNTLSNFMASFPDNAQAESLMRAFVNNLEKSKGLEDGVDIADSYASISETIKPIAAKMLENVKVNLDRNIAEGNHRGTVMYNLLYKLFLSADSTNNIDLSKEFGIPPVYNINYNTLTTDSQGVVMQVFFYGDEDGRRNYQLFVPQFANANWKKVQDNKNWIAFSSTKGKPITIYANKPLNEETGELDKAQEALNNYLAEKGIQPTVVVHRGHSYYADYTIKQIQPSAKIVFLGSCGGYHLIHSVLKNAPDAHIIASKQIGKEIINRPFIDLVNEKLRNGQNIEWISFWREFRRKAGTVEGFDDYIPPHKNLGAIFIKAYKSQMGEDESGSLLSVR